MTVSMLNHCTEIKYYFNSCSVHTNASIQSYHTSKYVYYGCIGVTVFYQRAGEEAVRVVQLSCSSGDLNSTTYESVSDKLLILEQK